VGLHNSMPPHPSLVGSALGIRRLALLRDDWGAEFAAHLSQKEYSDDTPPSTNGRGYAVAQVLDPHPARPALRKKRFTTRRLGFGSSRPHGGLNSLVDSLPYSITSKIFSSAHSPTLAASAEINRSAARQASPRKNPWWPASIPHTRVATVDRLSGAICGRCRHYPPRAALLPVAPRKSRPRGW
jgi:hypothetical protein